MELPVRFTHEERQGTESPQKFGNNMYLMKFFPQLLFRFTGYNARTTIERNFGRTLQYKCEIEINVSAVINKSREYGK